MRLWHEFVLCCVTRPCSWVVMGCLCPPPAYEAVSPAMMPGQIPDPSLTAGALPGLGPLTGLPGTALTAEELKCADIRNIGAMISPLQFLEVKLGKRPQPVKSEVSIGSCWLQVALRRCYLHLPGFPFCPCLAVTVGWLAVYFISSLSGDVHAWWQLLH